jgi:hypothetical protein
MTLSFHKVMFSAEEVLDILNDVEHNPEDFEHRFVELAEDRSREKAAALCFSRRGQL